MAAHTGVTVDDMHKKRALSPSSLFTFTSDFIHTFRNIFDIHKRNYEECYLPGQRGGNLHIVLVGIPRGGE